jgi:PAS domain S-box-containing protein
VYPSEEGLNVFFRDITEKKPKELELQNSLYKLRAILNSTTDFNLFLNPDFSVVSFNRKAADNAQLVFGKPLTEESSILDYIPDDQQVRFRSLFQRSLSGEEVVEHEMVFSPERSVWFRSRFSPVKDDDAVIIGVSLNIADITEQKRAQIQVQNVKLLEVTRVQSHDLRRPVANILGLIYLFNSDQPDYEFNRTLIESLQMSVEELDRIIHRIVDLTQGM